MNKTQFWKTIDHARKEGGRWQDMHEPLLDRLSALPVPDIVAWHQIMDKYRSLAHNDKLWSAAATMMNGCSDDCFDYFLGWLIAQGKEVYLSALRDPDSLAGVEAVRLYVQEQARSPIEPKQGYEEEPRYEGLLGAAYHACERARGDAVGFYRLVYNSPLSYRTISSMEREIVYAPGSDEVWHSLGRPRQEIMDRLKRLCPRLFQMFREEPAMVLEENPKQSIHDQLSANNHAQVDKPDEKPRKADKGAR